jgi:hypothetical protein
MNARLTSAVVVAACVFTLLPSFAGAHPRESRFLAGGGFALGVPTGEFANYVGNGYGFNLHGAWREPSGVLALRLDATALIYGSETERVPLSDTVRRVDVDVTTNNWIGTLLAGPQLMVPRGPFRPYVRAQAGVSYFWTDSRVSGARELESFASTTNFDDVAFAYGAGAGVYVPLGRGRRGTWALDLGAFWLHNGRVSYLTEGDLREDAHGDLEITPHRSKANLVELRIGLTFLR